MDSKTVLIIYIGIHGLEGEICHDYLRNVKESVEKIISVEENFLLFFVPDVETVNIKVDCINPKLLTKKEYQETRNKIIILEEKVEEFLKIKTNEEVSGDNVLD